MEPARCRPVAAPRAQAPRSIGLVTFPGGFGWPIWAAQEKAVLRAPGRGVNLTPTPNSVFQRTNSIGGRSDVAVTAIHKVVAYVEGQGESSVQGTPDLIAVMGGDNGSLRLVTAPEVTSFADLRDRDLWVDAPARQGSFGGRADHRLCLRVAEAGGIRRAPAGGVNHVRTGGVLRRFEALLAER